ncbi:MAG: Mrp/NBP35 family ATP-binding protein [Lachnospiraceae bacterium]|nr:Mrp/NBP35 family ATP-binding protein [Lachnospiraceae bacterium]MDD3615758.1 Mrp/NBP35 family ATP-binding protein [Lachnospiraceae bacterium]
MSENCSHNCSDCSSNCSDREGRNNSFLVDANPKSTIRKVVGVVSGKGGVGKSLVTSMLAVAMQRQGYQSAILDADITGPSIPKMFGIDEKAVGNDEGLLPAVSKTGLEIMSVNLLLDNPEDPVIWRGPVIAGVVKQFWSDVIWQDVDCMFVDMPPGTGDVPLTVFQSIPLDGIIIVASPQDLVSMVVEKAAKMADKMGIPILGMVENMSYFKCPDCGKKHAIFGDSHIDAAAAEHGVDTVVKLPINPDFAALSDAGRIEDYVAEEMNEMVARLERI